MKINKRTINMMLLISLFAMLLTSFVSVAQTDSLAVWENIADGTLTSTWYEVSNSNWKGENHTTYGWVYNCTSNNYNWTYNTTTNGDRWAHYYEFGNVNDVETGLLDIIEIDDTRFYAVAYYLSFNGTTPNCYLIFYNASVVSYWNADGTEWTTNRSKATDYTNLEKDYQNSWIRVKSIWNFNEAFANFTVRFKMWEVGSTETIWWMVDEVIPQHPDDIYYGLDGTYYSGIGTDNSWDVDPATSYFRRIMFWNLSYTMTPGLNHVIECPTYSALDMMDDWADAEDFTDMWNATQIFKDFLNQWDVTSYFDEDFWGDADNQNDTTYVFTMTITDFRDFYALFFDPVPDDVPDNIVIMRMFLTTDGSSNNNDYCLIRWDTDNDGTYDEDDISFWTNDTNTYMYNGWTLAGAEGYCIFGSAVSDAVFGGDIFRDDMYYCYTFVLNWDMMYNGSSGERIGSDQCRMSMLFYDNDTDSIATLQDFYPGDDDGHYSNTDGHNSSDTPTFEDWNTSTFWTLFQIDTSITGESLSDPDDPIDYSDSPGLEPVMNVIPILASTVFFAVLVLMMWSQTLTVETLIAWLVAFITAVLAIVIMTGLI